MFYKKMVINLDFLLLMMKIKIWIKLLWRDKDWSKRNMRGKWKSIERKRKNLKDNKRKESSKKLLRLKRGKHVMKKEE